MTMTTVSTIWQLLHMPQWLTLHGLIVIFGLLIYVLTTHTLQQKRAPSAAISWVLAIALIPYIGLPLFLMFGTRKLGHAENRRGTAGTAPSPTTSENWPRQLTSSMGQPDATSYRDMHLHADGTQALQALWSLIDSAQTEIVLCTFILGRDPMGKALMSRLIEKARNGVHIRLMLDGVGRVLGGGVNLRALKAAGVQVAIYGPIWHVPFKSAANLRNHRKMAVADNERLWCGGRNFAAEYFEGTPGHKPWLDLSFDLAGPLAAQAHDLFERDWSVAKGSPITVNRREAEPDPEPSAQIIASGPDQKDDTIHDLLISACFKAHTRILAVTPYFVPSEMLLMAFALAARRDVSVDLVIPMRSNHRLADYARHRALRVLSAAGGRIWLVPHMLHAKAVVFDEDMAISGSANLDSRSLFLNYELAVAFYTAKDIRSFAGFIEAQRASASPYHGRKPGLLRDFAEGLVLWLAYQL